MPSDLFARAAKYTGLARTDVERIVRTAPKRYKTYRVPKRSGGERTIAQPARELKDLQYFLMSELLSKLPFHRVATAYRKGLSIRDNAKVHAANNVILKMDFRDFFGSVRPQDFDGLCADNKIELSDGDREFCHKVLFWQERRGGGLKLSIGAPSSPMLSNAVMYAFDELVSQMCQRRLIAFSRYADDLTFSSDNFDALFDIQQQIPDLLRNLRYPVVYLNSEKTVLVSKKHRRTVTGLVLTNDGKVSLGRDRKRQIRAGVHTFLNGRLDDQEAEALRGQLAFANSAEPDFVERLRSHYGTAQIDEIFKRSFRHRQG